MSEKFFVFLKKSEKPFSLYSSKNNNTGVGSFLNIFKYLSTSACTSPGNLLTKDAYSSSNTAEGLFLSSSASIIGSYIPTASFSKKFLSAGSLSKAVLRKGLILDFVPSSMCLLKR